MPKKAIERRDLHVDIMISPALATMIDEAMEAGGYSTKTEFLRAALREMATKILERKADNGTRS